MPSHKLDYEILGASAQTVEIILDPGETVIAEAGVMNYMTEGIRFETRMGDGSSSGVLGKLWGAGKRLLTGESLFMTHFSNQGKGQQRVGFAAPYPGTVVPIDLSQVGGRLICQKDAFLCAAYGTEIGISFNKRIGAGFFGGEGFILQKLSGRGTAFLEVDGYAVEYALAPGEQMVVDTGNLAMCDATCSIDIQAVRGVKNVLFGGEGLFHTIVTGPGRIVLQTMPVSGFAAALAPFFPTGSN